MEFKIIFYKDSSGKNLIEEFVSELAKSNRVLAAKIRQGIEKLRNRTYHRAPLSKYLEPNLWELRVSSGSHIARVVYTFRKNQLIILLHIFVKKQQKTPEDELIIARKRLKEVCEETKG